MSATYDASLPTDKDWVRFLVGDRTVSSAVLQDEEIAALLVEEKNKYLAAARAGETILARTQGVVSKQVDDLSISFGDSAESAYRAHIKSLRERGATLLLRKSGSSVFRLL